MLAVRRVGLAATTVLAAVSTPARAETSRESDPPKEIHLGIEQYGGTVTELYTPPGGWIGPGSDKVTGVRYVGLATRFIYGPKAGTGVGRGSPAVSYEGEIAVEHRAYRLLRPGASEAASDSPDLIQFSYTVPRHGLLAAGLAEVSIDWRTVGLSGGLTAFESYPDTTQDRPTVSITFDAELRFHPFRPLEMQLGWGSYSASTLFRPALFAGIGLIDVSGAAVIARVGGEFPHFGGDADAVWLLDAELDYPLSSRVRILTGAARLARDGKDVESTHLELRTSVEWVP